MYTSAEEDFAKIIAQHISGLPDANPDPSDYVLASKFVGMVEESISI